MKCLITGATGFVGQNLSQFLYEKKHEVIALVRDLHENIYPSVRYQTHTVFGDIRDYKRIREILLDYKPDAIIHLAAQALVGQAQRDPYSTWDVNVNGTISLLSAWAETGYGRFLYFSSDKVYGDGLGKKETDSMLAAVTFHTASP